MNKNEQECPLKIKVMFEADLEVDPAEIATCEGEVCRIPVCYTQQESREA